MSLMYNLFRCDPHIFMVKADSHLFREGDPSDEKMYVLLSGQANILVKDRLAEEAMPGTIIGEMGIVSPHEVRTASVHTVTDCEFAEINPKRFNFLVAESPDFALEVMRVLADRLRRADQHLC